MKSKRSEARQGQARRGECECETRKKDTKNRNETKVTLTEVNFENPLTKTIAKVIK